MANTPAAAQSGIAPTTAAGVIDLYREAIVTAPGTYTGTGTSDDYRFNAVTNGVPTRNTHALASAYSTQRTDDSYIIALRDDYNGS